MRAPSRLQASGKGAEEGPVSPAAHGRLTPQKAGLSRVRLSPGGTVGRETALTGLVTSDWVEGWGRGSLPAPPTHPRNQGRRGAPRHHGHRGVSHPHTSLPISGWRPGVGTAQAGDSRRP